ncbi:hypothetical protein PRIPAC_81663 [Pristionchus pacificus]|uniref:Uncharacterized protein n=1 Tax=Pristionchus pacificus TaxID=54126 RepID=A0A2A6CJJ3_PRIPA|nr:hypothetical protein PRIPAC_81663 [Pristionchus pacificus]|eukprot:PDM78276.1 hypothetical protein PRIPAC_30855 [Pristionchus pacificus]
MDSLPSALPMPPCYYDCVKYDMAGVRSQSECTACSTWEADFKAFAASYSNDTSSSQSSQDSSCGGDVSCDSAYTFDRPECYAECLVRVAKDQGRMCDECDRFNKEEDAAIRESIEAIRARSVSTGFDAQLEIPQPGVNRPLCWYTCFMRQSEGGGLRCEACQAVNVMNERLTKQSKEVMREEPPSKRVPLYLRRGHYSTDE